MWSKVVGLAAGKDEGSGDRQALPDKAVGAACREYTDGMQDTKTGDMPKTVNLFYDLVTDFYEWGWSGSFHFAPKGIQESFTSSLVRHEAFLAIHMGAKPGDKILDVGCGVGGPMRAIAQLTRAYIYGLNNNAYQLQRCRVLNKRFGLSKLCDNTVQANFMEMPWREPFFDHAYAIEATCHAPSRKGCFSEVFRSLKPGGTFCGYEWCMTPSYNADDPNHVKLRKDIEHGNSLPELPPFAVIVKALEDAGFVVEASFDLAAKQDADGEVVPWWQTLYGGTGFFSLESIKHSDMGVAFTHTMCRLFEAIHIAPKGTVAVHEFLLRGRDGLRKAGRLGIFTPMFFFKARKPL